MGKHGSLSCIFKSLDLMEKELCELCKCFKKSARHGLFDEGAACCKSSHHEQKCSCAKQSDFCSFCQSSPCKCREHSCD